MKKHWFIIAILLIAILAIAFPIRAEENALVQERDNLATSRGMTELTDFLHQLDREMEKDFPQLSLNYLLESFREGESRLSFTSILNDLLQFLFRELSLNLSMLGKLIILAILASILQNLQAAFEDSTIGLLANGVVFLALVSIALASFQQVTSISKAAIDQMVNFIYAMLPVLLTLIAGLGGFATAAIVHPIIIGALSLISSLTVNLIFPLIYIAAILIIVNHISQQRQVSRLAKLTKDLSIALLGLFLTIFIGILSIQGVAGAVADGVGLRTAKFLTSSFVPVVGKPFSDAIDAVLGTSLMLKNAISLVGLIAIVMICLIPAVKIISVVLIYRLAAAVIQPLGQNDMADMLESLAGILILTFGAVAVVGLMFFLTIGIIAGLGNFTVMLR